jgi:dihydrofolate synthase/folylpolyglutamate synthase
MYTSPHITFFEERIRVNGRLIEEREVFSFLERHWEFIRENRCTFFEVATAMAMDHFRSRGVDIAVVEVGLGGTHDATRVVRSVLSVITRIDYDHTDRLGNTLEEIARDKAGIFREGKPALTFRQRDEVMAVLKERARHLGAVFHEAESLASFASLTITPRHVSGKTTLKYHQQRIPLKRWKCPLTGSYQVDNIRLAIAAGTLLSESFPGLNLDSITEGLNRVSWPGRLQELRRNPTLIVDVGHNPGAIRATLDSLHRIWKGRKVHVIFSALRDKDIPAMIAHLKAESGNAFIVPLPPPRGLRMDEITNLAKEANWNAQACPDVNQALQMAFEQAEPRDIILAVGSHYLAEEVLKTQKITKPSNKS